MNRRWRWTPNADDQCTGRVQPNQLFLLFLILFTELTMLDLPFGPKYFFFFSINILTQLCFNHFTSSCSSLNRWILSWCWRWICLNWCDLRLHFWGQKGHWNWGSLPHSHWTWRDKESLRTYVRPQRSQGYTPWLWNRFLLGSKSLITISPCESTHIFRVSSSISEISGIPAKENLCYSVKYQNRHQREHMRLWAGHNAKNCTM